MVLVTGATGFIGKVLIQGLIASNVNFRILARNKIAGLDTEVCDFLLDEIPIKSFKNVDTIIHLAGFAHDFRNQTKTSNIYYELNVGLTVKLATIAVENNVKKFIFISSVKAGGRSSTGKCMTESQNFDPEDVYGRTKKEAELKILKIGRRTGMHVTILRPSLVYGPNVKGNLRQMYLAIKKGWFPPLPETGNIRSLIHVDDLVRAIFLVVKDERTNGQIYNVTDGVYYSSRDIYTILSETIGREVPKWFIPELIFYIAARMNSKIKHKVEKLMGNECYSSEKLNNLGFKPKFSLKEINEASF